MSTTRISTNPPGGPALLEAQTSAVEAKDEVVSVIEIADDFSNEFAATGIEKVSLLQAVLNEIAAAEHSTSESASASSSTRSAGLFFSASARPRPLEASPFLMVGKHDSGFSPAKR